jgi:hypothetical protein
VALRADDDFQQPVVKFQVKILSFRTNRGASYPPEHYRPRSAPVVSGRRA